MSGYLSLGKLTEAEQQLLERCAELVERESVRKWIRDVCTWVEEAGRKPRSSSEDAEERTRAGQWKAAQRSLVMLSASFSFLWVPMGSIELSLINLLGQNNHNNLPCALFLAVLISVQTLRFEFGVRSYTSVRYENLHGAKKSRRLLCPHACSVCTCVTTRLVEKQTDRLLESKVMELLIRI